MPEWSPAEQAWIIDSYAHLMTTRYITVAALTWYFLDCIATLREEIQLVWTSRWTPVTVLYIVNRYTVFPTVMFIFYFNVVEVHPTTFTYVHALFHDCITVVLTQSSDVRNLKGILGVAFGTFTVLTVITILQLRLHAIYGRGPRIMIVLTTLSVMTAITMITLSVMELVRDSVTVVAGTPFCMVSIPQYSYAFWIPPMILDSIFLLLVCLKSYEHYRSLPQHTWRGTRLMNVLVRDSVFYFLTEFSIFLFNVLIWSSTLVWHSAGADLLQLGSVWATIFPPAVAARLVLNIRREFARSTSEGTSDTWGESGEIVFELAVRSEKSSTVGPSSEGSTAVDPMSWREHYRVPSTDRAIVIEAGSHGGRNPNILL
ncbi:hypothetical protein PHLGIDRAFT_125318 [Phlebiopsis gigantea 11061_1 CR5-6]|uniref:DUF6533 domain-containing protein n=1 Tax=Phlebiopsis gigantea (strain 11061_1 CR5-6) TaxID=745531 RepID=A0A0C3NZF9_PHLG1|nr:hypothetical protein PHLGIDRAFT_125318 [Phlebiopsis gigantea 11061_1 CR5-6]